MEKYDIDIYLNLIKKEVLACVRYLNVDYVAHLQCMVTQTIYNKCIYICEMSFSRGMQEYRDGYLPMYGFMSINHMLCSYNCVLVK